MVSVVVVVVAWPSGRDSVVVVVVVGMAWDLGFEGRGPQPVSQRTARLHVLQALLARSSRPVATMYCTAVLM
jgi:hypothetical protein